MRKFLSATVCVTAVLFSSAAVQLATAPALAQDYDGVSFEAFHDQLAPYGDWVYSDRWGEVWIPEDVPDDFHPYRTGGYWAYTDDYGWTWVSDYEWGDIPFHYGRWVNDPYDGWLWIPGYVWSPGWVIWRSNGMYTGWMPMPPDDSFLRGYEGEGASVGISFGGIGLSFSFGHVDDYYGYSRWYGRDYDDDRFASNWFFLRTAHLGDRDYRRYAAPRQNYITIIRNTTNITNYRIVNNYVVNRSVDVHQIERAGGHPIVPMRLSQIMRRPQFVTRVDMGRQVQDRMRMRIPRGTGIIGSAPKPPPEVIRTLSTGFDIHRAAGSGHLFTRETVIKAPLPAHPVTGPVPQTGPFVPGTPPGQGTTEERFRHGVPMQGTTMQGTPQQGTTMQGTTVPGAAGGAVGTPPVTIDRTKLEEFERQHGGVHGVTTTGTTGPSTTTAPSGATTNAGPSFNLTPEQQRQIRERASGFTLNPSGAQGGSQTGTPSGAPGGEQNRFHGNLPAQGTTTFTPPSPPPPPAATTTTVPANELRQLQLQRQREMVHPVPQTLPAHPGTNATENPPPENGKGKGHGQDQGGSGQPQ